MTLSNSYLFGLFTGFKITLIILIILISWVGELNPNDPTSKYFYNSHSEIHINNC